MPELDIEQIKATVNAAVGLRPPRFPDGESPRVKVSALEDYLLESAWHAAELEEALHYLTATVAALKAQVEQLDGYEVALPRKAQDRITQTDIMTAKRAVAPAVFDAGAEAKQLTETTRRQIERLRFEEQWIISRAYSMISGGS